MLRSLRYSTKVSLYLSIYLLSYRYTRALRLREEEKETGRSAPRFLDNDASTTKYRKPIFPASPHHHSCVGILTEFARV